VQAAVKMPSFFNSSVSSCLGFALTVSFGVHQKLLGQRGHTGIPFMLLSGPRSAQVVVVMLVVSSPL
jgi:hypothetical protein